MKIWAASRKKAPSNMRKVNVQNPDNPVHVQSVSSVFSFPFIHSTVSNDSVSGK